RSRLRIACARRLAPVGLSRERSRRSGLAGALLSLALSNLERRSPPRRALRLELVRFRRPRRSVLHAAQKTSGKSALAMVSRLTLSKRKYLEDCVPARVRCNLSPHARSTLSVHAARLRARARRRARASRDAQRSELRLRNALLGQRHDHHGLRPR